MRDGWDDLEQIKNKARQLRFEARKGRSEGGAAPRVQSRARARQRRRSQARRRLDSESRTLFEARRRAERKIKFIQHVISYVCVILFLSLVARPVAVIVALCWGIGLTTHFFKALVAPGLRRRWIQAEVDRQVGKRVTRERRHLEGEQLRSLEELSASIAHEIRNPITAAKSLVQQMGEDPASAENVEYANVALSELDRVERSISHLLRYAREEEVQIRSMRMSEVVDGALETLRERIASSGVQVDSAVDSDGEMEGDPEKLRRVIINRVGNAIDSLEEAGLPDPHISVSVGDNLAGNEVWVRVSDNGPGIDADTQRKMFRPFYTSKANGTGLGLAISKKLVDAHRGAIEVESAPGAGAEFVLTFPKHGHMAGPAS
jgi:signal transduction histidine kinase